MTARRIAVFFFWALSIGVVIVLGLMLATDKAPAGEPNFTPKPQLAQEGICPQADPGWLFCRHVGARCRYCPSSRPFWCPGNDTCFPSEEGRLACGGILYPCGGPAR